MKHNYKRTFDAVSMPPDHQKRIRSELLSRFSEKEKVDNVVNIKSIRKPRKALVAAVVALTIMLLAGAAYAYSNQILLQFLTGPREEYEEQVDSEGNKYYVTTFSSNLSHPAEVRDGRIYFVLDGSDTDITSYCSEETYYEYEQKTDDGLRHVILVGGTPDDFGWAEFIWKEDGSVVYCSYNDSKTEPMWLKLGKEAYEVYIN